MKATLQPITAYEGLPLSDCSSVYLNDREDAQTIRNISSLSSSILQDVDVQTNKSLAGRVSKEEPVLKQLQDIPPAHFQKVNQILGIQFLSDGPNYLIKIRELIAKNLEYFGQFSEQTRTSTDETKQKYRKASQDAADIQRTLGNAGLVISSIAFGLFMGQSFTNHPQVMKFLSEQMPSIGGLFTSRYQATQKEADALSQLLLAEYNAKTQKGQSDAGNKQEFSRLLDVVMDAFKRAASSG